MKRKHVHSIARNSYSMDKGKMNTTYFRNENIDCLQKKTRERESIYFNVIGLAHKDREKCLKRKQLQQVIAYNIEPCV